MDIDEILGKARLPESSVPLCLAGDLQSRWEELDHQLGTASAKAMSLGEIAPAKVIAEQMQALRDEMAASEVIFRLRALDARTWAKFRAEMPEEGKTDEEKASYDDRFHRWACKALVITCFDPAMTVEKADQLSQRLSEGQWQQLTNAVWELNAGRRNIPFSSAASVLTQPSEPSSPRPEPGVSPTADGSAPSNGKSRRTSTAATGA